MRRNLKLFLVFLVSISATIYVFRAVIFNLNTTSFSQTGDGLKEYYVSYYHIKYDNCYWYSNAMNYPYGESVFYAIAQPLPVNAIKFITKNIVDISPYTIGILNGMLILAMLFTTVFLYLIFNKLKIPFWLSLPAALFIAFLTPQMDRFSDHFGLAYPFALPAIIYLLLIFYENPKFWKSACIFFLVVWGGFTHAYFAGMFALILLVFWCFFWISLKQVSILTKISHVLIQFILPIIFVQLVVAVSSSVPDRTSYPNGFFYYRAYPQGVFLPITFNYGMWLNKVFDFSYVHWEGWAYIGAVAVIFSIYLILKVLKLLSRKTFIKTIINYHTPFLPVLFIAGTLSLLYSFGIPFIFHLHRLVDFLGPLRQIRSIGRFTWPFYYIINILSVYYFYCWIRNTRKVSTQVTLTVIFIAVLACDSFQRSGNMSHLNNKQPLWVDTKNNLPENNWLHTFNSSQFQACITFPFFSVGCEDISFYVPEKSKINEESFLFSLKTGLPFNSVWMSRTSLGQSLNNIAIIYEPYRKLTILNHVPNRKDFVLICDTNKVLTTNEVNLVRKLNIIGSCYGCNLYVLHFEQLNIIADSLYYKTIKEFNTNSLFSSGSFYTSKKEQCFYFNDFDSLSSSSVYSGRGAYTGFMQKNNVIFRNKLSFESDTAISISFWFGNIDKDLHGRTTIYAKEYTINHELIKQTQLDVNQVIKTIDKNWALVEFYIDKPNNKENTIQISVQNKRLWNTRCYIDCLLIKPIGVDVYSKTEDYIMKNNRYYLPKDKL